MIKKMFLTINETKMYVEQRGKGTPIVILHGWSVDHNLMSGPMEKVFKKGNKHFKRLYIDLPGMGKSSVNESVNTADAVLDILLKLIDTLIPDEDFLLAGESWGGALCRGIMEYKKDKILGLCLLCPVSISSGEKTLPERIILEKDEKFLISLPKRDREYFTSLSVVQTKKCWRLFKRDVYPALRSMNTRYLSSVLKGEYTQDMYKKTLEYERPVLILTGRQDNAVGYKNQMKYFMDFPRASLVVLDKTGHNLQIEQEKLFQTLLGDWLERVRSYENT